MSPVAAIAGVEVRAYAKLNLTLEVLGKRADGFHELASLVQCVSLADTLRTESAERLDCQMESWDEPLTLADNLAARAALALAEGAGRPPSALLTIRKGIPGSAGLGGGSADAAAALIALNRLWGLRRTRAELQTIGARLGSDVPLFLQAGGTTVLSGRGDLLTPLPNRQSTAWFIVVVLRHTVPGKTASLYGALRADDYVRGAATARAIRQAQDGASLAEVAFANSFERAAREVFPGLDTLWRNAEEQCDRPFHLSGAGPAIFAVWPTRHAAAECAQRLRTNTAQVFVVRSVRHPLRMLGFLSSRP